MNTFILIFLACISFAKKERTLFHVLIVSENISKIRGGAKSTITKLDTLERYDIIEIQEDGYCVLFDNKGNIFEFQKKGKVLLDTLRGRSLMAFNYPNLRGIYSNVNFNNLILDKKVCRPIPDYMMPFSKLVEYNQFDTLTILVNQNFEQSSKLVIKNAYGDVELEVKLERDLFLALFNYKDKLIGPLGYIFSIERNCENFGNQRVFKITKNIIYNDSNLLNTSASLLIRAFYMEKEGYSPEAKILYEESISKAKSNQIKIYKDLYILFKARWNIE